MDVEARVDDDVGGDGEEEDWDRGMWHIFMYHRRPSNYIVRRLH